MCSKLNQVLQIVRRNNEATMSLKFDNKENVAMLDEELQAIKNQRMSSVAILLSAVR
jgi:hypothetical protein